MRRLPAAPARAGGLPHGGHLAPAADMLRRGFGMRAPAAFGGMGWQRGLPAVDADIGRRILLMNEQRQRPGTKECGHVAAAQVNNFVLPDGMPLITPTQAEERAIKNAEIRRGEMLAPREVCWLASRLNVERKLPAFKCVQFDDDTPMEQALTAHAGAQFLLSMNGGHYMVLHAGTLTSARLLVSGMATARGDYVQPVWMNWKQLIGKETAEGLLPIRKLQPLAAFVRQ